MEQFSLEKYLENPSRKITTRYGDRKVRIICTDRKDKRPIVALMVNMDDGSEYITSHSINGWIDDEEKYPDKRDLFFADKEEELTEFEKEVDAIIDENIKRNIGIKYEATNLLNLARKELEKDIEHSAVEFAKFYMEDVNPSFEKVQESEELWKWKMSCLRGINKAYTNGKQDALKDLADWKNRNSKGLWDAEKVCKFLYEKVIDITYFNKDNTNEHYDKDEFIDDLRKAMEE